MYTSAGSATNFGASAIADFNANKALALTRAFGRVMLGTAPISSLLVAQSTTYTATNGGGNLLITTANNVSYFNGMPIVFTNSGGAIPTGLVANAVYYVSGFNGSTAFNVSTTFGNAIAGTVIAWTNAGSGTNTVTAAVTGSSEGEYAHTQLLAELATHNHGTTAQVDTGAVNGGGTQALARANSDDGPSTRLILLNNAGSSTPFNVTQPSSFYNIYFKL
jgi:hypothetical protein